MNILVHDYAGHAFTLQLARQLAHRGHNVLYAYCGSVHAPQGDLQRLPDDAESLQVQSVALDRMIPKRNFIRRFTMEREYGKRLVRACKPFAPEVVLSANTPSITQNRLARWCKHDGVRLVSWVQDIYGLAAQKLLRKKIPVLGNLIGKYFISLDKASARMSSDIVVIAKEFCEVFDQWSIPRSKMHVVHNWSPLQVLPAQARENSWAKEQALGTHTRFIYSGTLAMKHNPKLLLQLAKALQSESLGEVLVVSEGEDVDWLAEQAKAEGVANLKCLGFQPFNALPQVLGSADVLVAVLEADAGVFSVPSKVLSYLCAGRALLLAVPEENLIAAIVRESKAGRVVGPKDIEGFCQAGIELAKDVALRENCGKSARAYAEEEFGLERITNEFETILCG